MRSLGLVAVVFAACSQADPAPLTVRLEGGMLTVRNDSTQALHVAEGTFEEGVDEWQPLGVGLEVLDAELGAWRWYGEDCRHRMTDWSGEPLAPGATAANNELPQPDSAGRFRYVIGFHRAGEEWQWLPAGEFEERRVGGREPSWERGGTGKWQHSSPVQLRVSNLRPDLDSKHTRFLMDLEIVNGSDQPISYNVTTNFWWCEEAGRWFRHPGWTICGNSSHPEIGVGQIERFTTVGKGWGHLCYGMRFDGQNDDFQARSKPFEVPYPWPAVGEAPTSD